MSAPSRDASAHQVRLAGPGQATRHSQGDAVHLLRRCTCPLLGVKQDFANWSVDFIKRAAQDNKPFYLIHAFAKVHFDNYPGDGYQGRSPAKLPYKDAVVEVDDIIGRLIETLKETGQEDNTLVFFASE
jgi:arylsulfatase A-like enzyme